MEKMGREKMITIGHWHQLALCLGFVFKKTKRQIIILYVRFLKGDSIPWLLVLKESQDVIDL
jgi:hypothetical protein